MLPFLFIIILCSVDCKRCRTKVPCATCSGRILTTGEFANYTFGLSLKPDSQVSKRRNSTTGAGTIKLKKMFLPPLATYSLIRARPIFFHHALAPGSGFHTYSTGVTARPNVRRRSVKTTTVGESEGQWRKVD